jgi:hypothetical protein
MCPLSYKTIDPSASQGCGFDPRIGLCFFFEFFLPFLVIFDYLFAFGKDEPAPTTHSTDDRMKAEGNFHLNNCWEALIEWLLVCWGGFDNLFAFE